MAEQDSKPTTADSKAPTYSRRLLPFGLGLVALLAGCFWWGSQPQDFNAPSALATTTVAASSAQGRPPQADAALTRVASSLAQSQATLPTTTPTAVTTTVAAESALVPLPTVTPTVIPSPLPTRTIEFSGDATLRLNLNSDTFASNGQPVTLPLDARRYVLGAETMTQSDEWCTQIGATGLVFDLTYTLNAVTENLHVGGEMRLYDGFCGEWGSLGNVLASAPMNLNVPVGATALLAPTLQFQGSFLGIPNILNITTGVFLDLSIRNPGVR